MLIGVAFEQFFCPNGREFEQANLQKLKCPGGCLVGGGGGDVEASISLVRIHYYNAFQFLNLFRKTIKTEYTANGP